MNPTRILQASRIIKSQQKRFPHFKTTTNAPPTPHYTPRRYIHQPTTTPAEPLKPSRTDQLLSLRNKLITPPSHPIFNTKPLKPTALTNKLSPQTNLVPDNGMYYKDLVQITRNIAVFDTITHLARKTWTSAHESNHQLDFSILRDVSENGSPAEQVMYFSALKDQSPIVQEVVNSMDRMVAIEDYFNSQSPHETLHAQLHALRPVTTGDDGY